MYQRSESVRVYVLRRAGGVCECCGAEAPFITTQGRPTSNHTISEGCLMVVRTIPGGLRRFALTATGKCTMGKTAIH